MAKLFKLIKQTLCYNKQSATNNLNSEFYFDLTQYNKLNLTLIKKEILTTNRNDS